MSETAPQRGEALTTAVYLDLRARVEKAGFGPDIEWAQTVKEPVLPVAFFSEYAWVLLNSGMREQVARIIWERVRAALDAEQPVFSVFRHPGKAAAIQEAWERRAERFVAFQAAADKMEFLRVLPWIGPITVFHLAKNCGIDCAKPDRHLERIAGASGATVEELCAGLARETGDRVATVDYVIWRAANMRWV